MTNQASFFELEYAARQKQTQRDLFVAEIEAVTPVAEIGAGDRPLPPEFWRPRLSLIGLSRMLRMYVAQQFFGLSDESIEDALCDSQAIRSFVGIDLAWEATIDPRHSRCSAARWRSTQLTESISSAINAYLVEKGLLLREGSIADANRLPRPKTGMETGQPLVFVSIELAYAASPAASPPPSLPASLGAELSRTQARSLPRQKIR